MNEPGASERYAVAQAEFERIVTKAETTRSTVSRRASERFDPITL